MSSRFASAADYGDIAEVRAAYPGTVKILVVGGGWMVFATEAQFAIWGRQRNLNRIRETVELAGVKIGQYGQANAGNTEASPIDRHVAELMFNVKMLLKEIQKDQEENPEEWE